MKQKSTRQPIWLPLAIALAVVVGIFIGSRFTVNKPVAENDRKLNAILNLIAQDYVDTTNLKDLIEMSIPEILSNLDPHTSYFSVEDLKAATDDLNGSFSGIGISFVMVNDTIGVVEVIPGGPSEKVGIMAGDKIVMIDDSVATGPKMSNGEVMKRLRGNKGSKVKLGIKRQNTSKLLTFTVTRGDIPVNTVDAYYMIDKNTGYIKINQFGRHTYDEFITAMASLEDEGAKRYIIDLRGNGGGFMEMAVLMVNEFLPADQPIVFTKGRYKRDDSEVWSDGNGSFQDAEVAVLIDEFSASASEIFAGAMQDNDRGLIVGCRSFGKGLVQKEFVLPDSSRIAERLMADSNLMTAGPMLIQRGIDVPQRLDRSFVYRRHNRTAMGLKPDGTVVMLVVDGRHRGEAEGLSLPELTRIMRWLGCRDAVNLDGGGSSTMYIRDRGSDGIVNNPSDNGRFDPSGQRRVANAILVVKRR